MSIFGKTALFSSFIVLGLASPAWARSPRVTGFTLSKSTAIVFAPDWATQSRDCEISPSGVEIRTTFANITSTERKNVTLTPENAAALQSSILSAQEGPIVESEGPTDVPVTAYRARVETEAGPIEVTLSVFSQKIEENKSNAATTLRRLMDELCR